MENKKLSVLNVQTVVANKKSCFSGLKASSLALAAVFALPANAGVILEESFLGEGTPEGWRVLPQQEPWIPTAMEPSGYVVWEPDFQSAGYPLKLLNSNYARSTGVIYDGSISSGNAIDISFEYAAQGLADGFTFFLIDGDKSEEVILGSAGGFLGYAAQKGENYLTNAFAGFGFHYFDLGGFADWDSRHIGILGPAAEGMPRLAWESSLPFSLTTPSPFQSNGGQDAGGTVFYKVNISISPAPELLASMEVITSSGSWTIFEDVSLASYDGSDFEIPSQFKFGFTAGDGDETSTLFIKNLVVSDDSSQSIAPVPFKLVPTASAWGLGIMAGLLGVGAGVFMRRRNGV